MFFLTQPQKDGRLRQDVVMVKSIHRVRGYSSGLTSLHCVTARVHKNDGICLFKAKHICLNSVLSEMPVMSLCSADERNIHLSPTLTPVRSHPVTSLPLNIQWTWHKTHLVFILCNISAALLAVELAELRWGRELSKCQLALQHHRIGSRHVNARCRLRSHGGSKWSQCWLCWKIWHGLRCCCRE